MNQKSLFDYMVLGLFIMCMGFALSATLEYSTAGHDYPYLLQGAMLLSTAFLTLLMILLLRANRKLGAFLPGWLTKCASWLCFTAILAGGFALRMYVIRMIELEPASDFETYYRLGQYLSEGRLLKPEGQIYRNYVIRFPHTIGFPSIVLAPAFAAFGTSVKVALYANLVFSMASIALVYFIARQQCGRLVSLGAMGLMAIWPSHVLYSSMVASEPVFTFFILLCLLLFSLTTRTGESALRNRRPVAAVVLVFLTGAFLGVANAIRPMAIVLAIALCMVFLLRPRIRVNVELGASKQFLARGWMCALIVVGVYSGATMITNQNVYALIQAEPVTGLTASGYNLMVGVNSEHFGIWNAEDAAFFDEIFAATQSGAAAQQAALERGVQRMISEPENTLNLFVYKFRDLWQTDDFGVDWNLLWLEQQGRLTDDLREGLEAVRPLSRQLYFVVLVFAMLAGVRQWSSRRRIEPVSYVCMLFFIGTALLHMLLETQVRYHYNMIPFLILLGAFAMAAWQERTVLAGLIPRATYEESEGIPLPQLGPEQPALEINLAAPVGEALTKEEQEPEAKPPSPPSGVAKRKAPQPGHEGGSARRPARGRPFARTGTKIQQQAAAPEAPAKRLAVVAPPLAGDGAWQGAAPHAASEGKTAEMWKEAGEPFVGGVPAGREPPPPGGKTLPIYSEGRLPERLMPDWLEMGQSGGAADSFAMEIEQSAPAARRRRREAEEEEDAVKLTPEERLLAYLMDPKALGKGQYEERERGNPHQEKK